MMEWRQRGFTLAELVVVIVMFGVLAAIAMPLAMYYLNGAKERSYIADRARFQAAVDGFYNAASNVRFLGKRQYPLIGRMQTSTLLTKETSSVAYADNQDPFSPFINGTTAIATWNPVGGTEGSDLSAKWWDVGLIPDMRDVANSGAADRWTSVVVKRDGVKYHTDPRYFMIDFELLVTDEWMEAIPESASEENNKSGGRGTYTGHYSWYVDDDGAVQALYYTLPLSQGYQDNIFP